MSEQPSILEMAARLRSRQTSPVEVTKEFLARIERFDSELSSFTTVTPDLALAQARLAEEEIARGEYRSPLHGVPLAVKDIVFTKGVPTASGMPIHRGW